MRKKWHLVVSHIVFILLIFPINHGLDQLEVSSRGFLHSAIEIQSVATSLLVVPWLHILKFMSDSIWVIPHKVMERNSECSWLLSEVVRVILNRGHSQSHW